MEIVTKMKPIKYVRFEYVENVIEVPCCDFIELMEDLEDTDIVNRVVIYNSKLADYLEGLGLITRNAKGSYCKTNKFDEEWPKIREEYYKLLDD